MLTFLMPVKSPEVSKSWPLVCRLFERTVKSICQQTTDQFAVVVICNRIPEIDFQHPNIHFVQVDFPLPTQQVIDLGLEGKFYRDKGGFAKELDKGRKLLKGLEYAKQFSPSHVMAVDADDCISKHLAAYVNARPSYEGWYIKKGYLYHEHRDFLQAKFDGFCETCGSSIIIKPEHFEKLFVEQYIYEHRVAKLLEEDKIALKPLPFFGAIYSVGNSENIFQTVERQNDRYKKRGLVLAVVNLFRARKVSRAVRSDFSFYKVDSTVKQPEHEFA